jgi:Mg2+/Co2+ transporter CorB
LDNIPLGLLFGLLAALIFLSAFFSGSETAILSINRYRLKHKVRAGHRGATLINKLLENPDRLIGVILLGTNLVNVLASMLTTIIAMRIYPGEGGLVIAAFALTLIMLIFAESVPKTFGALHPEAVAYPVAYIYAGLLKLLYPFVLAISAITTTLLKLLRITPKDGSHTTLSREELSTVVQEAGVLIPQRHKRMLLNILALEEATVEDIMVPRNEVVGIDLAESLEDIREQLNHINHTRIPIYREKIDNIVGILHAKRILRLISDEEFDKQALENAVVEPYFIPEGTSLTKQLLNFQKRKRRLALVVDEYGDLLGLVTLEGILEQIVGEFTTESASTAKDIYPQADGSFLVDGGVHVRDLNKVLDWSLPTDGPKTLNGIILEYMEMIPEPGTSLLLHGLPVEIIKTQNNTVKTAKVYPDRQPSPKSEPSAES